MRGKICEAGSSALCEWNDVDFDDRSACVVEYSRQLMDQVRRESCGKDVFCREGTWQVSALIGAVAKGEIEGDEGALIRELLGLISENAGCDMSSYAAAHCLVLMDQYSEEWDRHLRRRRCTNLICKPSYTLYIAPELCNGCENCIRVCPLRAIAGEKGFIHIIDTGICDKCGKCIEVCPKGAVKKSSVAGFPPKVPAEPVPVGSFGEVDVGDGAIRRRRRRRE
ncbi:4Fe-4S dicluster domain-containing protein [Aminipila butyrica]|uniref:Ferredoxin n=1 Tax=Aminipila butyrica TaxID=433296 RepID=A0A858BUE8_9FIRM|nr:4Fe-4S binding protein [Aminipila butyrica]QIB68708.1 4Fe-4S dicluster domain-containing protein [Aminipila butyrica]